MAGLGALVMAAIFFGAAIYINLAEHPARLRLQNDAALAQWGPSYKRGFAMQATVAIMSGILGLTAWWESDRTLWLVGALVILANWPFTLLAIMPTNRLLEQTAMHGDAHTRPRLIRWGYLHAIRSALGALATILFLIAAAQQ